jgi:tetratricopeptide (TPR) repeat protein
MLYHAQVNYRDAEPLFQRALAIREKALGPEHLDVATSLNNLALVYQAQGKYADAEPLYKRSLEILEKAAGPPQRVTTVLANYAALLKKTGRGTEAKEMKARAKTIREKHARANRRR